MLVLWERERVSIGELCECLHLDVGTLSPLLRRMAEANLIVRRRDTADERRVLVTPTSHGRSLHNRARHIPITLAQQAGLTAKEVEDLRGRVRSLLTRLIAAAT